MAGGDKDSNEDNTEQLSSTLGKTRKFQEFTGKRGKEIPYKDGIKLESKTKEGGGMPVKPGSGENGNKIIIFPIRGQTPLKQSCQHGRRRETFMKTFRAGRNAQRGRRRNLPERASRVLQLERHSDDVGGGLVKSRLWNAAVIFSHSDGENPTNE